MDLTSNSKMYMGLPVYVRADGCEVVQRDGVEISVPANADHDAKLAARARAARAKRQAPKPVRTHRATPAELAAANRRFQESTGGAFNRAAAEAAPKTEAGQKTNVPGQGPAKGPGGQKTQYANPQKRAKRERKQAQRKGR